MNGNLGPAGRNVNTQSTAATPFNVAPVITDPVADIEEIVRQWVGAFPRDAVDTSLVGPAESVASHDTIPPLPPTMRQRLTLEPIRPSLCQHWPASTEQLPMMACLLPEP